MPRDNSKPRVPDNTGLVRPDPNLTHQTVMRECFLQWEGQTQVIYSYWEIVNGPSRGWMFLTRQTPVI